MQSFLMGECLLGDAEANSCWYDLTQSYAEVNGTQVEYTLFLAIFCGFLQSAFLTPSNN